MPKRNRKEMWNLLTGRDKAAEDAWGTVNSASDTPQRWAPPAAAGWTETAAEGGGDWPCPVEQRRRCSAD